MLHHVDVHVRNLESARELFDALGPAIGYRRYATEPDFMGYEPMDGGRPRFGLIADANAGGAMRLAFAVERRELVDAAARAARERGALSIEGPGLHPEYGADYYAVFFEDADRNRFEVLVDIAAARPPRFARLWRSRVKPGQLRAYRRYIKATGIADYRNTEGNCGAWLLSAEHDENDEVLTLSFWDSREAIVRFAGEPIERAQYYSEDEKYLLDFPKEVEHFSID